MNGFLNIYKERGFTSHDCVAKLRGILRQKKIGHMGTLDPDAEGVLPVALGKATRLIELFDEDRKAYRVTMLLGRTTDTLDTSGTVLEEREVLCSGEDAVKALLSFRGEQMQIPPMYSAVKKNGRKLYELAREGVTVEREPRKIVIHEISNITVDLPLMTFDVTCSRGTYIRSLCDDCGRILGCGGCMAGLIRLYVGSFRVENALRLSQIEALKEEDRLAQAVLPMTAAFPEMRCIRALPEGDKPAHNGNALSGKMLDLQEPPAGRFWLKDSQEDLIGIYENIKGEYRPVKMVYEETDR